MGLTTLLDSFRGWWTGRAGSRRRGARVPTLAAAEVRTLESRTLLSAAPVGGEVQVNTQTAGAQGSTVVATDADGDYVIAWHSNYQDGAGYGIYAQRYNGAGAVQGSEFRVNTYTTSTQGNAAVAMDADGDFVIAWRSSGQDGSNDGIYAQRYNGAGVAQGSEFRANSYTTGSQSAPAVAMDADGDFVISWQSSGQDGSGNGIYAQRYNGAGVAQGSEFQVNSYTTGAQRDATIAIDADGDFVIAWHSYLQDGSNYGVYAQRYNAAGVTQGSEFRANSHTTSNQNYAAVAMDTDGDFVIAWQSYGQDGSAYGLYAQRYNGAGVSQASEFRVNSYTTSFQTGATVAMDGDGDFVVAWRSLSQDGSSNGVYSQEYNAAGAAQGSEFRVNSYTTNQQASPAVVMDTDGDFVVAWNSYIQDGSGYGVYAQRYAQVDADGPVVDGLLVAGDPLLVGEQLVSPPPSITVAFSEDLAITGAGSVTDTDNWALSRNGVDVSNLITGVTFGLNATTTNYEAVVTFSAALTPGDYVLTVQETVTDLAGNALDGNDDGTPGGDFTRAFKVRNPQPLGGEFQVNTDTTADQNYAAVATDADGDFVIAWQSNGQDGDVNGIYAQRYNAAGVAQGSEFQVNSHTASFQLNATVAMDTDGDFVIAWQSYAQDGSNYGIYAQRYNATGVAQGSEFQVNSYTTDAQQQPAVAMDADGDFVVAWQSYGQSGNGYGIYAQRYNAAGVAQGSEFQVNSTTADQQTTPAVAMDADGDFVVTWQSNWQDSDFYGVYAQRYNAAGVAQGSEFQVNSHTTDTQTTPTVAMDADGDFVIAWQTFGQDGDNYGVYAQQYSATGVSQGSEFQVNSYTTDWQTNSAVAMDADGDFVVAWASYSQDGSSDGIFTQRYAGGTTPTASDGMLAIDEHSANATVVGTVSASDSDSGDTLTYAITAGNTSNAFAINSATGQMTVNSAAALNFETAPSFTLTVQVTDAGFLDDTATIIVNLNDVNDAPTVVLQNTTPSLAENTGTAAATKMADIVVTDDALGTNILSLTGTDAASFEIVGTELRLKADMVLNFETQASYDVTVSVNDTTVGSDPDGAANFTLSLTDVNEAPVVTPQNFLIGENSVNNAFMGTIAVADDAGQTTTFAITAGNTNNAFTIDSGTGVLRVNNTTALNYETITQFNLTVTATDNAGTPLSDSKTVTVFLRDVNEASVVTPKQFLIAENSVNGAFIGTIPAMDVDAGQTKTYSIIAGNTNSAFAMDAVTGVLTVNNTVALNYEAIQQFNLVVRVVDNGSPAQAGAAVVTVFLRDVNEAPVVTPKQFLIAENSVNGAFIGTIPAIDVDAGQTKTYSIIAGNTNNAFAMDAVTGVLTVNNTVSLNYEAIQQFNLVVRVVDNGSPAQAGAAVVTVFLRDVNEAPVVTPKQFLIGENSVNGAFIGTIPATDVDAGQTKTYSIIAGNTNNAFAINAITGALTVNNSAALDFEMAPQFNLTVRVTDNGNPALSSSAAVTVFLRDTLGARPVSIPAYDTTTAVLPSTKKVSANLLARLLKKTH